MNKNLEVVSLMTWLVPYCGVSFEHAELVAKTAIQELGGGLSEASPSDAVKKSLEVYFRMLQEGLVKQVPPMSCTDFGFVRPPLFTEDQEYLILSDDTPVSVQNLAMYLNGIEIGYSGITRGFDPFSGDLILASCRIPALEKKARKRIWPAVFANPYISQEEADRLILDRPKLAGTTHLERSGAAAYKDLLKLAKKHCVATDQHHAH